MQDKLLFTKHLALMLKSGVAIGEALQALRDQGGSASWRKMLGRILVVVDSGKTLEEALAQHPKVFDPLYLHLVHVGEQSGNLEKNLDFLADKLKAEMVLRARVQGGLLYPGLVLGIGLLVGTGVAVFVLPKLADLFLSLDVELPLPTRIVLWLANLIRDYGLVLGIGSVGGGVALAFFVNLPVVKPIWQAIWLRTPVIGLFMQQAALASMCRNLGIMLESGLPISQALLTESGSSESLVYRDYLHKMAKGVESGQSLAKSIVTAHLTLIPPVMVRMLEVGEKTGSLDKTLLYLAGYYEELVEETAKNMSVLLEPVVLTVVGLLVAFVALAIISPIYQFTGSIKR